MKVLLVLAALALTVAILYAISTSDEDWCIMGKSTLPCSMTIDALEIKIHDAPEDR